ncbi:MAG: TrkH family potassium uptake protein [Flavobacteriales bacterium Tduv]
MISSLLRKILPYFTITAAVCLILSLGWREHWISEFLDTTILFSLVVWLMLLHVGLLFERAEQKGYRAMICFSLLVLGFPILEILGWNYWYNSKGDVLESLTEHKTVLTIGLILYILIRTTRLMRVLYTRIDNPAFIFVTSFIFLALGGTGLLLLPEVTVQGISFIDALFTSTSAVCVTGLVVLDTAKDFTFLGKVIIMILMELGGLGILTITSFFGYFFRGGASFREGLYMSNFLSSDSLNNVMSLAVKVVGVTLAIECVGAVMIYYSIQETEIGENGPFFFAAFHSVSAFCNAGFSTFSEGGLYAPKLRNNYTLHLIIACLLILGGIGFNILFNFYTYIKLTLKKYFYRVFKKEYLRYPARIVTLNTHIVVITTIILLFIGTIFYYIVEYDNSLAEHRSLSGKWIAAFFSSATPRTAGFQVIDVRLLSPATIFFTMLLMWIGASSASTGGGIKTSAFALALLNIFALSKGKNYLEIRGKQISSTSIRRAFAIITLSLLVIGFSILMILTFDPEENMLKVSFEAFSAFSTVGLSLGITANLTSGSKVVLIVLMLLGRIGTFNLMVGMMKKIRTQYHRYPKESILIN